MNEDTNLLGQCWVNFGDTKWISLLHTQGLCWCQKLTTIMTNRIFRECVSMDAAGARTHRSLRHHLLHPLKLRLLVLCAPTDFETQSSPGCSCTLRSKFLTHSLDENCTLLIMNQLFMSLSKFGQNLSNVNGKI